MAGNNQRSHITGNGEQELQFLKFHNLYSAPLTGTTGQFYFNTATYTLYTYGAGWTIIPKLSGNMTAQQLMVGNVHTFVPITPPVATSFVKVNTSSIASTSQYIAITDIATASKTTVITAPGLDTRFATEKAIVDYVSLGIGTTSYIGLTDTIDTTYVGKNAAVPMVNTLETGLELVDSELATFDILDDTPASKTGYGNRLLKVNSAATAIEYSSMSEASGVVTVTSINLSGGTASKYYGTDAGKTLVPMTDPIVTASNGLTKTLLNVEFGGTLTKNTTITSAGYSLSILGNLSVNGLQYLVTPVLPAHTEGFTYWDSTDHCMAVMSGISSTILQVGQETWVRVRNVTGIPLSNGKAVYITGRVGDRPTVALALATSASTSVVLGIVTQTIAHNSDGFVTLTGLVRGVNTAGYPANDTLYLSAATAGEVTNVIPASPNYVIKIGNVATALANGSIAVLLGVEPTNHSTFNHVRIYGSLEVYSSMEITRGNYIYHSQVIGVDTIGDWRVYSNATAFYTEYCTLGNATKGAGTWIMKNTIQI